MRSPSLLSSGVPGSHRQSQHGALGLSSEVWTAVRVEDRVALTDVYDAMDRKAAKAGNNSARRSAHVVLFHVAALVGAAGVAWATAGFDRWKVAELLLLAAFAVLSTLTDVNAGVSKVRVAGDMIGTMMTIALLGPG
ncbi:MAG TPA: hypothetical protein VMG37_23930, partial [Solirubrobacteraceae bacterium]|nr:hypothetical protein [Solirubrobacteraceae bacterium]